MEANGSAGLKTEDAAVSGTAGSPAGRLRHRGRGRPRAYWGLLIFVAVAGVPMIGVPSLRMRLKTRIGALRDAAAGVPVAPAPVVAQIGENREPFPKEYEHPSARPYFLPKSEPAQPRPAFRIVAGAPGATAPVQVVDTPPAGAPAAAGQTPPADTGGEPQFKKGPAEQEAYDIVLNSNQTLAGMVKGNNPKLKFQDWSAASLGGDSYYVMVTFVQAADNVPLKYIWRVRVQSKDVSPESSLARSISK